MWRPIIDLPVNWSDFVSKELSDLANLWKEQRDALVDAHSLKKFNVREEKASKEEVAPEYRVIPVVSTPFTFTAGFDYAEANREFDLWLDEAVRFGLEEWRRLVAGEWTER